LKYRIMKPVFGIVILAVLMLLCASNLYSQEQQIRVTKGKSTVIEYHERIKAVSLANEDVADVVSITPTAMVVIGKEQGITSLIVWGESEKLTSYEIKVDRNTSDQQVVLDVQVAEVNKTALSEYGFDFLFIDTDDSHIASGTKVLGSYAGEVTSPNPASMTLPATDNISGVIRWLGDEQKISTVIKTMQRKGELELLANPHLLCLSGQKASFLVGGEIPVPVAQSVGAGGIPSVSIQWKEYGIRLDFIPTVVDTNLINLRIMPEVSSLDYTNAVSYAGYDIPALRTRKADAIVELNSEQSIVMGGLLSSESFETIKRVPILGHIPILGFFFSHKETSKVETELLIIISPRIIASVEDEEIPPLPFEREPDEMEEPANETGQLPQGSYLPGNQPGTEPGEMPDSSVENTNDLKE
jgi:Flp pilus assembly secretin CpaC